MKQNQSFWDMVTERYRLVIRNEKTLSERSAIRFTYARLAALVATFIICVFIFSFLLSKTVLSQWFDPRHAQHRTEQKFLELSMRVDSLAMETDRKELLIRNLQNLILGQETTIEQDSASSEITVNNLGVASLAPSKVDSAFRKEFEATLSYVASEKRDNPLNEMVFIAPVSGIVSDQFDLKGGHYGVDVVTKSHEPVKCIADGMVTFASWTQDFGYVMIVQHKANLISIYKHNAELLKKIGNFVNAGDIITIVGNTGEMTSGHHLHFELWYNGIALNPEEFVTF